MPEPKNPYAEYQPPENAGQYFKFKPNTEHRLRLLSAEPYVYESHFIDPKTQETSVSTKYSWLVWNFEAAAEQILTLPVTGYKEIAKFGANSEFGDLRQRNLTIKRTGEGFDTRYAVVVSPSVTVLAENDPRSVGEVGKINLLGKLEGDDKVQFPMLLSEAINNKSKGINQADVLKAAQTADDLLPPTAPTDNLPTDEDMTKPVDLSEIPF
ncbi:MAG: hypothetical protein ACOH18_05450 [Candidatus Saccharimonadaceae bacterium]